MLVRVLCSLINVYFIQLKLINIIKIQYSMAHICSYILMVELHCILKGLTFLLYNISATKNEVVCCSIQLM